jgi:hypothetical protein
MEKRRKKVFVLHISLFLSALATHSYFLFFAAAAAAAAAAFFYPFCAMRFVTDDIRQDICT